MTEAIFDFAAINRRMNRKPEPVAAVVKAAFPLAEIAVDPWRSFKVTPLTSGCTCPECVDSVSASEPTYSPSALNESAREFMANMAAAALRASLDETETVFIGWDVGSP